MATDSFTAESPRRTLLSWNQILAAGFLTVSALDLMLTWRLLAQPASCFYEANPLAQYVLAVSGWWGLTLFKVACAGTVVGVSALLARRHPRAARALLVGAVPVVCLVVGYSLCLIAVSSERNELAEAHQRSVDLEYRNRDQKVYARKLAQGARAILANQQTVAAAARQLHVDLASLRYNPLSVLAIYYPSLSDEARLAISLVREANFIMHEEARVGRPARLAKLKAEFASTYAVEMPLPSGSPYAYIDEAAEPMPRRQGRAFSRSPHPPVRHQ